MKVGVLDENSVKSFAPLSEQSVLDSADIILGAAVEGAEKTYAAAGIMAVKLVGTDADVLDFYVAKEYRNKGVGEELLKVFNELAYNAGVDSTVFSYDREKYSELDEFLENQGASLSDNLEVVYSFKMDELTEEVKEEAQTKAEFVPVSELTDKEFEQAEVILSDVALKDRALYCKDFSLAARVNNKICAIILVSQTEGIYSIDALGVRDKIYAKELMGVVNKCAAKISAVCKADDKIYARAINSSAAALISKITGQKAIEESQIVTRYIAY